MPLLLVLFLLGNRFLHTAINELVVDFKMTSPDNNAHQTGSLINSGFFISFSLTYPDNIKRIDPDKRYFTKDRHIALIGNAAGKRLLLKDFWLPNSSIDLIYEEDVRGYNTQILAAISEQKNRKLQIAFPSPLDKKKA